MHPRRAPPPLPSSPGSPGPESSPQPFPVDEDSEAEAERHRILDEDDMDSEGDAEGEDLFGEDMEDDYRGIDELDVLEQTGLDDRQHADMSAAARLAADREVDQRREAERIRLIQERRGVRLPAALLVEDEAVDEGRARRRRREQADRAVGVEEEEEGEAPIALEEHRGPLREYISRQGPRDEIARRFLGFLNTFYGEKGKTPVYAERIQRMGEEDRQSLEVSYVHLSQQQPILAMWVADAPTELLKIFDEVATKATLSIFEYYSQIQTEIHVRITDLPLLDDLRNLRQSHLNQLVKVYGVVTRRTGVFPQLKLIRYECSRCGFILDPITLNGTQEPKVGTCPNCQSRGPFTVNNEQTVYRNYQKMTLQESPGTVPAGRLPRTKEIILTSDLIDSARPGEEIELTGIYRNTYDPSLNTRNGFPVFATVIEANHLSKREDLIAARTLTRDDLAQIEALRKEPSIGQRIIHSIAPSIYGHDDIKTAITLALFGGCSKNVNDKHRIRGDLNVLMLGDPGTAKSQFLKYLEQTSPRAVFTTGKGASAVGLTASVRKDPITREWTLEGGALVLADQGMCLIDEFDKMSEQDRTSIHEAMEQQSISVSKAGIVTTLQARCSVVAAANPIGGKYNSQVAFSDNVELTEPILSRFDVLCVVRDLVDPILDEKLAKFVVGSHQRSHPKEVARRQEDPDSTHQEEPLVEGIQPIPQDLLRKYILHARRSCRPRIQHIDRNKLSELYSQVRRASGGPGDVQVTVRAVESTIRLTEAHAKMYLRNEAADVDLDVAIRVTLESFINTQKWSVMTKMRRDFRRYIVYKKDAFGLLLYLLQGLVKESLTYNRLRGRDEGNVVRIDRHEFESKAREVIEGADVLETFYQSEQFRGDGFLLVSEGVDSYIVKRF